MHRNKRLLPSSRNPQRQLFIRYRFPRHSVIYTPQITIFNGLGIRTNNIIDMYPAHYLFPASKHRQPFQTSSVLQTPEMLLPHSPAQSLSGISLSSYLTLQQALYFLPTILHVFAQKIICMRIRFFKRHVRLSYPAPYQPMPEAETTVFTLFSFS